MTCQSISTVDTVYSADAIEFCPTNHLLFACGTYQIEKEVVEESPEVDIAKLSIEDKTESDEDEEDEIVSATPIVTRYGRCLMYKIDSDGTNL